MRKIVMTLMFAFGLVISANAQTTVSGRVTDANGKPVPNVSVTVKGSKVGTSTAADGTYSLTVPASAKAIEFSSIGFEGQSVSVASKKFSPVLVAKDAQGQEVVITVPYGSVKKKNFTGAESTVNSATLTKQQVTSVTKALEGLIPGLIATNGGGQPGDDASIRIRGFGSINASSSPLYVLDGIPYDGSISSISTDDIESVTVLKDAAAAALYGSRAANGVIMITTKKGKKGKPTMTVNLRKGMMTRGIPEYDRVGAKQYYELFWEAYKNYNIAAGLSPLAAAVGATNTLAGPNGLVYNCFNVADDQLVDPTTGKFNPNAQQIWNDNWEDALFRSASRTNATFSISGANENLDYMLSAGYLKEDGIMLNSGLKRYNFRTNINSKFSSWLSAGVSMDASSTRNDFATSGGTGGANPFYFSRYMAPIYPIYLRDTTTGDYLLANGQKIYDYGNSSQMGTRPYLALENPRGTIELDQQRTDNLNGNLNTYVETKFLKYFALKATLGLNYYNGYSTDYQNPFYGDAQANAGRSTKSLYNQLSITGNEVLSYTRSFNKMHNFRAIVGHENYKFRSNNLSANSTGFLYQGQTELNNGSGPFSNPTSSEDNQRIESYFTNVNYDYDSKYLLSASYRRDGSSRFRDDVRWGNFYSVGAGWILTQAKFMQPIFDKIKVVDDMKLRLSYGEQGNEDLGLFYPYKNYYYADGTGGYSTPTRAANPDLKWEKNKVTNIGLDFTMLDKRLTGSFEWYNRVSDNLLFDVPLPPSTGYSSVYQNVGTMKNTGIELQLGYNVIAKKSFNWRIDVNMTHFKNEITKLPKGQEATGIVTGTKKLLVGHSIYDFWMPEYAGVDAVNGDALYYIDVTDAAGNVTGRSVTNQYSKASYGFHGSAVPKFTGGVTNSFNYKGFDLSFLLTFSYGSLFYDGNYAGLMQRGNNIGDAFSTDIEGRWQNPGDITNIPRLQSTIANQDGTSTRFLMDGSWLNIKNVTLNYTLPQSLLSKYSVSSVSVFVNLDNALLFTAKKGMDPQRAFNGVSDQVYTPYRTLSTGITVNFK